MCDYVGKQHQEDKVLGWQRRKLGTKSTVDSKYAAKLAAPQILETASRRECGWVTARDDDYVVNVWLSYIDGQVHLVHLQTDNFHLFLRQQTANFPLHNAQRVNGLRNIPGPLFSVLMSPYSTPPSSCFRNLANGKQQLPFVRCNGKRKQQTSVCLLKTETENRSLFSLVGIQYC